MYKHLFFRDEQYLPLMCIFCYPLPSREGKNQDNQSSVKNEVGFFYSITRKKCFLKDKYRNLRLYFGWEE